MMIKTTVFLVRYVCGVQLLQYGVRANVFKRN